MNPLQLRRAHDLARVRDLCARSGGQLQLLGADGEAPSEIRLRLRARVALDAGYPRRAGSHVDLRVLIPAGYPLREPPRTVLSPVPWHPNVFADGTVCQGRGGQVSEFLDLYVQRIVRIATYQPDVTNLGSVANPAAARWYAEASRRDPGAFPTDTVAAAAAGGAGIRWQDAG
jgi:hypothetical protein